MRFAEAGIEELLKVVDTLLIIPNQNLFRVANERTTFAGAFPNNQHFAIALIWRPTLGAQHGNPNHHGPQRRYTA